jgi:hypothetical protein
LRVDLRDYAMRFLLVLSLKERVGFMPFVMQLQNHCSSVCLCVAVITWRYNMEGTDV